MLETLILTLYNKYKICLKIIMSYICIMGTIEEKMQYISKRRNLPNSGSQTVQCIVCRTHINCKNYLYTCMLYQIVW
jgi:hypothetical protein